MEFTNFTYDIILWMMTALLDLFFREVKTRGSFRIPKRGGLIFVVAPHANQFVDPLLLMRQVQLASSRRIFFLIAEKSMKRKFVGFMARLTGSIPVARPSDYLKQGTGKIVFSEKDPMRVYGIGTLFTKELSKKSMIVISNIPNLEVADIVSDTEIILKEEIKEFPSISSEEGLTFKILSKIDQSKVYSQVFKKLEEGKCIGIFPEGGSHDRSDLLPLKAGVAIMALGALANNPNINVKIVPCGMNYFNAHRFRSCAVLEFGTPLEIPKELVEKYKSSSKHEAIKAFLDMIYNALMAVTVRTTDYETLMFIQAGRRLYKPGHRRLPLQQIVELNRRFIMGYNHYKDDPRVVKLRNSIVSYNRQLYLLGIRDYQVQSANYGVFKVITLLIYRFLKFLILAIVSFPGVIMFAPIFIATKIISKRKAKEALDASTVKIQGNDVLATWKLLVALALVPALLLFYSIIITYLTIHFEIVSYTKKWICIMLIVSLIMIFMVSFAALRFGESGLDIYKSLRPLFLSLNPTSANTIYKLRQTREELAVELTHLINTLGPELFPDFDPGKVIAMPEYMIQNSRVGQSHSQSASIDKNDDALTNSTSLSYNSILDLSRNTSLQSLSSIQLFANNSFSSSSKTNSLTEENETERIDQDSISSKSESFEEVSKEIRKAMKQRIQKRKNKKPYIYSESYDFDISDESDYLKLHSSTSQSESETISESEYYEESKKTV
ncbi:hypothetical protein T552_03252 [Pneumocystis carinii B80]|uniref:Phospholipid/glycerol acyltransferase domain-containing protein n=1 Tax=Pneumocystis carinii (strain B80) TaxID=1408658 RepID=A0A0W4ZCA6_PNEC8|nr:hypothetical protein T552_03252 [Pneumocystis carinii B80]KTW25978.1 hypothetical protein T552_03252 [Pneumocystis carinii B80]